MRTTTTLLILILLTAIVMLLATNKQRNNHRKLEKRVDGIEKFIQYKQQQARRYGIRL